MFCRFCASQKDLDEHISPSTCKTVIVVRSRVRHSNAKMEAMLVCGSMENGGMFDGKLHGKEGKIVSDRLAWLPFFHLSAVPRGTVLIPTLTITSGKETNAIHFPQLAAKRLKN